MLKKHFHLFGQLVSKGMAEDGTDVGTKHSADVSTVLLKTTNRLIKLVRMIWLVVDFATKNVPRNYSDCQRISLEFRRRKM
jgi:hypothetical protein